MENIYLFLYAAGLTITIGSYIFLIYYFIKEKVYKDIHIFDILILLSGPIGLIIVIVLGWLNYGNDEEIED
jgi:O-antigen/teichoic acid export membrane protein